MKKVLSKYRKNDAKLAKRCSFKGSRLTSCPLEASQFENTKPNNVYLNKKLCTMHCIKFSKHVESFAISACQHRGRHLRAERIRSLYVSSVWDGALCPADHRFALGGAPGAGDWSLLLQLYYTILLRTRERFACETDQWCSGL